MTTSKMSEKAKRNVWDLDLRVRDRNLTNGTIDAKMVEKHLADLPDLEAQAETVELEQPALDHDDDDDDDDLDDSQN